MAEDQRLISLNNLNCSTITLCNYTLDIVDCTKHAIKYMYISNSFVVRNIIIPDDRRTYTNKLFSYGSLLELYALAISKVISGRYSTM